MTSTPRLSRRALLRGLGLSGAAIRIGLPALDVMFNDNGTAYAAGNAASRVTGQKIEKRFVLWFNGNGILEKHWIPRETGKDFNWTPCLKPLAPFRNDVHILTGLDNPAARDPAPGNGHHRSMSALISGKSYTGNGAGGATIDQLLAAKIGRESRFRSLQIGVCQDSLGESIQRNLSWAGRNQPLPPEVIPHRLFDRIFGSKDEGWIDRKKSILDAVGEEAARLQPQLGASDKRRLDEYLTSVRDLERAIAILPPEYQQEVARPDEGGDLRDWPRIAKLQSDLLVHALASGQTRVASYMLTKCQGISRFQWLGYTHRTHHAYTHAIDTPEGQRILADINRWHVEELAYLVAKLKSMPEGSGTLLDHTCLCFIHEHAEANSHKNNGLAVILAGHTEGMKTGMHSKVTGTIGDLFLTLADEVMGADLGAFPTAHKKLTDVV